MQQKSFTVKELAELTQSEVIGNPNHLISYVDELETATVNDASFLDNPRYEQQMRDSKAGVIFVSGAIKRVEGKNYLVHKHPTVAFQKVIDLFIPKAQSGFTAIHKTALIHDTALIGEGVTIGPYAVIERGVTIGAHTTISAHVSIGAEVVIGSHCMLYPHAVVRERCSLGNRVILQPGCVIGSCGFGYFTDGQGRHHALEQRGSVIIEDDVEIGANTTIDRARFKSTRIMRGTKIDNLVQIAHQVQLGEDNLIISQVGIAGSTKTGRNVVLGGQVGVVGHIVLADEVMMAARSAATKSILKGGIYSGAPAMPLKEHHEQVAHLRNIKKLAARIKALEDKDAQILP